ncbi:MAG TPA: hypothetical protein VGG28_32485 [Kofleriaceae bacterium]
MKLWVVCVLAVASATAWAQPGPTAAQTVAGATAAQTAATDQALAAVNKALLGVSQIATARNKLDQLYKDQLAASDRLKNERQSWRRDRDLRASMADANDTAKRLEAMNKDLVAATSVLATARKTLATAIDVELAAGTNGVRGGQLARTRAELDAVLGAKPKKIVMPDDVDIDTLDPEDLEQQAQAIADTEKQLANQVAGLDQQATELARLAELRKSHDRANDMMIREDDQPHRDVHSTSGTTTAGIAASPSNGAAGGAAGTPTGGNDFNGGGDKGTSFESEATFVLGEVIDPSTLDTLARASKSGDPAKRAAAARATRDAVAARLEQLKKKRALIEQREKQLKR